MPNVVVIDRTPDVRNGLSAAIRDRVTGAAVIACDDGEAALDVLRSTPVDVVSVDAALGGGVGPVGVLLASAARRRGATLFVRSESGVNSSVRGGVGRIVAGADSLEPLTDAIVEAALDRSDREKMLGELTLLRVLEEMNLAAWSGALSVRDGRRKGSVVLSDGNVVYAVFDTFEGDEAIEKMLRLVGGTITQGLTPVDFRANVTRPTATVLSEAAALWAAGLGEEDIEITEEDLVDFMGLSNSGASEPAFQLFSDEELAELALDDTMAIPIPRTDGPPPAPDAAAPVASAAEGSGAELEELPADDAADLGTVASDNEESE